MKITVQNLGTIKKTTLDLQPLTVIIGPNNTSKTYLAYLLYGLLGEGASRWEDVLDGYDSLTEVISDPVELSESLAEMVAHVANESVPEVAERITQMLSEFFQDTSGSIFRRTQASIEYSESEISRRVGALTQPSPESPGYGSHVVYMKRMWDAVWPHTFLLPAERNALIITYRLLANRRFKLLRDGQRHLFRSGQIDERMFTAVREQDVLRYPQPIEDFLDFLTDIELEPHDSDPPFQALATQIETALQGGQRTRFSPTTLGGQEIKIDVSPKLTIDLYNASSSIKQLAPLLLFLRHRARPGTQLIIDEPEMNLHPESQARLLEALGILVNLGVNVLLTTHSPYFMSHLNNLAAGAADPERRARQAKHLYLGDERAFVPLDRISAYEMRSGKLVSLKDPDYGIRWDTLSDVSADLQQKYFQITEAAEGDGKA